MNYNIIQLIWIFWMLSSCLRNCEVINRKINDKVFNEYNYFDSILVINSSKQ
jgi:hypothetical protein